MTRNQATARLEELLGNGRLGSGDPKFIESYMAGDATARATVAELHRTIADVSTPDDPIPSAERAKEVFGALSADKEFVNKYLNGDVGARREIALLTKVMAGDVDATAKFNATLAQAERAS